MNLGEITPYFFEGKLIISLSKEWIESFGNIPKFEVKIDKNKKLVLQSKSSIQKEVFSSV